MGIYAEFLEKTKELFMQNKQDLVFQLKEENDIKNYSVTSSMQSMIYFDGRMEKSISHMINDFRRLLENKVPPKIEYQFKLRTNMGNPSIIYRWIEIFENSPLSIEEKTNVFNKCFIGIPPELLIQCSEVYKNTGKIIPFLLNQYVFDKTNLSFDYTIKALERFNRQKGSNFLYTKELKQFLINNKDYLYYQKENFPEKNIYVYEKIKEILPPTKWQEFAGHIPGILNNNKMEESLSLELIGESSYSVKIISFFHNALTTQYKSLSSSQDVEKMLDYICMMINKNKIEDLIKVSVFNTVNNETILGIVHTNENIIGKVKNIFIENISYFNELVLDNNNPLDSKTEGNKLMTEAYNMLHLEAVLPQKEGKVGSKFKI
jgi:hypothetical protein